MSLYELHRQGGLERRALEQWKKHKSIDDKSVESLSESPPMVRARARGGSVHVLVQGLGEDR